MMMFFGMLPILIGVVWIGWAIVDSMMAERPSLDAYETASRGRLPHEQD